MISDYFFVSNVCTGDFMNRFYNLQKWSPFDASATDAYDFMFLMEHINEIDFSKYQIIPYEQVKVINKGYIWSGANQRLGVNNLNTFALLYDKKLEVYYRHYELTQENLDKIMRRIQRFNSGTRTPFFIFHVSPGMRKILTRDEMDQLAKMFNDIKLENKLIVSGDIQCLRYVRGQKYKIFTTEHHE